VPLRIHVATTPFPRQDVLASTRLDAEYGALTPRHRRLVYAPPVTIEGGQRDLAIQAVLSNLQCRLRREKVRE
jgi:hypothetical protein